MPDSRSTDPGASRLTPRATAFLKEWYHAVRNYLTVRANETQLAEALDSYSVNPLTDFAFVGEDGIQWQVGGQRGFRATLADRLVRKNPSGLVTVIGDRILTMPKQFVPGLIAILVALERMLNISAEFRMKTFNAFRADSVPWMISDEAEAAFSLFIAEELTPLEEPTAVAGNDWYLRFMQAGLSEEAVRALFWEGLSDYFRNTKSFSYWQIDEANGYLRSRNRLGILQGYPAFIERMQKNHRLKLLRPLDPVQISFASSPEAKKLQYELERYEAEQKFFSWMEQAKFETRRVPVHDLKLQVHWELGRVPYVAIPQLRASIQYSTGTQASKSRKLPAIRKFVEEHDSGERCGEDPAHLDFLRWYLSREVPPGLEYRTSSLGFYYDNQTTALPIQNPIAWLNQWPEWACMTGDGNMTAGAPARMVLQQANEENLRWVARVGDVEHQIGTNVVVDGHSATKMAGSRGAYLLVGNVLHPLDLGGMPLSILEGLLTVPEITTARFRKALPKAPAAVKFLEGGSSPDSLIREVRVNPTVVMILNDEDHLQVSAHADESGGMRFQRSQAGQWTLPEKRSLARLVHDEISPAEAPTILESAEPGAVAYVPRRSDLQAIDEWLDTVIPKSAIMKLEGEEYLNFWELKPVDWIRLTQLWEERPRNVSYVGSKSLQDLLAVQKAPRYKVSVDASGSGIDWFAVSVELEEEVEALSPAEVEAALRSSGNKLVILKGRGVYRREALEELQVQQRLLADLGLNPTRGGKKQQVHALQFSRASESTLTQLGQGGPDFTALRDAVRGALENFKGLPAAAIDPATAAYLRPYQRGGADFLTWATTHFGGALLADDMGLGKTLQVLATLSALRAGKAKPGPSLVICPTSVVRNWEREAKRFAPGLRLLIVESGSARRANYSKLGDVDLVVTNYALARIDLTALQAVQWLAVIVDEAQAIKNPGSDISRAVKSIPSAHRIALTGTPIENRLMDLWSIMEFAMPGYLGSPDNYKEGANGTADQQLAYLRLRARLRPVLLRRLKAEVAPELPDRIEERIDCEMTAPQRELYAAEVARVRMMLGAGSSINGKERIQILAAITRLRQLCCAPELMGFEDKGSGKITELMETLVTLREEGHKVLVFSVFAKMLAILQREIDKTGAKTFLLTGQTKKRQDLVDSFEKHPDPAVFLISLKAGGAGINLTSATHVILFDPWWNPAAEAQAIDRTHRIGQTRTVFAFRLVTRGTIEERIIELQDKKRALIGAVLEEEAFNRTLSREDFEYLLMGD